MDSDLEMSECDLEVLVPLEPMFGTKGKRGYAKKEPVDSVTQIKKGELEAAREALNGKRASTAVELSPASGTPWLQVE